MNKAQRISDMMIYLNDKPSFNLKDIMNRYNISKSTALRDVMSLEEIGMPIFSQQGRNGCYGILENRLLSPIVFDIDEVSALYFSMLTLKQYQTTPFHLSVEKLKQKFEKCLSQDKVNLLKKTEQVFSLASVPQANPCVFLKQLLDYATQEIVCKVTYQKGEKANEYVLQIFDISSAYGQWYAAAYNFKTQKPQVLRCDKVLAVEKSTAYTAQPLQLYKKSFEQLYKSETATPFTVEVTQKGVDLFQKEHYPSMKLIAKDGHNSIIGFYNKGEEDFISGYFLSFSDNVLAVKPKQLAILISQKAKVLSDHFKEL